MDEHKLKIHIPISRVLKYIKTKKSIGEIKLNTKSIQLIQKKVGKEKQKKNKTSEKNTK